MVPGGGYSFSGSSASEAKSTTNIAQEIGRITFGNVADSRGGGILNNQTVMIAAVVGVSLMVAAIAFGGGKRRKGRK